VEKALKNIAKTKSGIRKISNFQFPISNKISNSKIPKNVRIIWLTPGGKQFDTETAKKLAKKYTDIIVICGRYEGIDARVKKIFKVEEISIGPYILTGGELPAEIIIDSVSRQVPGVLGNFGSLEESRTGAQTASHDVYTRPEMIEHGGKKYRVPKVLLSGDHKKIEEWKNRKNSSK
jgi:tRNA (guanine37-N1)-methyltransferase